MMLFSTNRCLALSQCWCCIMYRASVGGINLSWSCILFYNIFLGLDGLFSSGNTSKQNQTKAIRQMKRPRNYINNIIPGADQLVQPGIRKYDSMYVNIRGIKSTWLWRKCKTAFVIQCITLWSLMVCTWHFWRRMNWSYPSLQTSEPGSGWDLSSSTSWTE